MAYSAETPEQYKYYGSVQFDSDGADVEFITFEYTAANFQTDTQKNDKFQTILDALASLGCESTSGNRSTTTYSTVTPTEPE